MAKPRPNFYVLFAASLVVAVLVSVSVVGVNELGNFFTEKNGEPIRRSQLAAVQSVDLISNIGTASNWTTFGGTWTLGSDGIYRLTRPVLREGDGNGNIAANDTLIPNEFTLTTNAMVVATSHEWNDFSVVFGFKDINNYYYVSFNEYDDENTNGIFKVSGGVNSELFNIGKAGSENAYFDFDDNAEEKLYEGPGSISAGVTYRVKIERKGTGLEVFLNEVSVANIQIPESLAGKVGYGTRNDSANFSNLRVTEMVNVPDPTYALTVTKSGSGTVSAQGISCGNDCSETYALNTSVTLTATPTADSQFSGWLGSCSGVGSCMVTMNSAKSISATFTTPSASNTYILTIVRNGSGTVSGNGISCGTDCSESYEENSSVTLTATPAAGYTFAGWSGACSGSALCTVSINGPNTVIAVFNSSSPSGGDLTLTINKTGTGRGTISGGGIDCGATCTISLTSGTPISLSATPLTASDRFTSWNGACQGTTPSCTIVVTANTTVGAQFTTVSGNPSPLSATCAPNPTSITSGQSVLWTALATGGSGTYSYVWTGDDALTGTGAVLSKTYTTTGVKTAHVFVTAGTESVSVNCASATVSAQTGGNGGPYTLRVFKSGLGTIEGPGISCNLDCSESYPAGTQVTLTTTSTGAFVFDGWNGNCSGSGNCLLTMDGPKIVAASFSVPTASGNYNLTVSKSGSGTILGNGISCGADCSELYSVGTTVTLTATPDAGASFVGWAGDCSGTGACTVTMNTLKTITALFTTSPGGSQTLTVSKSGSGTILGNGISCGVDCTESYVDNTVVFIAAVPDSGSTFTGWTGACTGAGTCSVVMNSAKLVGATFTGGNTTGNFSLTVSTLGTGIVTGTGISCGVDCTESFPANTAVTLTAVPSGTASFTGWSGACSGVGSCLVTLNSNKSVVASFSDAQFGLQPLTVLKQGGGTGTVTGTRIICGADCTDSYANNTLVSLTAVPDFGFTFGGWTGDCSDSTICAIRMNGSKTVIATFLAPLEVMPAPPLGLTAFTSASCQSVDVSWQPVAGATSYSLYESGTSNRLYSGPATTFTQGDLIPNTGHSYTVTATLGGVTSRHSGQSPAGIASGSCAAQASLKVMLVDASLDPLPNVTWIVDAGIPQLHGAMVTLDSGTHEVRAKRRSGYILGVATCSYYGTSECFLNSPSEYATTNNGLNCSGVYCTATVDVPAGGTLKVAFKYVKAPGNITANPVTDPPPCGGKASLSWTAVNGATGYNVYRSNDATGPFVQINAFPVLFPMYLDSGLTPLSTHYYSVSTLAGPIETPLTKPSLGCSSELDVMLVLDRSGSIQQSDGVEALQTAAKNLISTLNPTADGMHMGLATFSGQATLNVPLGANASAMVNVIDNLSFGSGTQIDDGLRTAINELAGPNNRPDISDVIILITDGEPTSDDCQPGVVPTLDEDHCGRLNALVEASRARDAGIDLFIVGVALDGSGRTFLPKLAPDANHYVDAQFGTLDDELKSLTSCLPQSEILSVMAPASAVCPIVLDSIVCSSRPTPGYTIQPIVWSTLALPVRDYTYEWHFNGLGPGLVEGAAPISTTTKYTSAGTKMTRVEVFFNGERLGEASCNVEIFRLPGYQEG